MSTSNTHRFVRIVVLGLLLALLTPLATGAAVDVDSDPGSPVRLSNPAIAITLFRSAFNGGDAGATEALISPDATIHTPYGEFTGPEGLREYLGIIRRGYPNASFAVDAIDVQGDIVTVRWTMTATRYQIGPTEPVINVNVDMPGETKITVAHGQVADLTQTQEVAHTDQPQVTAARSASPVR